MKNNKTFRTYVTILWLSIILSLIAGPLIFFKSPEPLPGYCFQETIIVDVTVYSAVESQTDKRPLETASGYRIDTARYVPIASVSRDLLKELPYGTIIEVLEPEIISKYGRYFVVLDCMNQRFVSKIDILVEPGTSPNKWTNVIVNKLE